MLFRSRCLLLFFFFFFFFSLFFFFSFSFFRPFDVPFRVSAQTADGHFAAQALVRPVGGRALCQRGSAGIGRPDRRARGVGSR